MGACLDGAHLCGDKSVVCICVSVWHLSAGSRHNQHSKEMLTFLLFYFVICYLECMYYCSVWKWNWGTFESNLTWNNSWSKYSNSAGWFEHHHKSTASGRGKATTLDCEQTLHVPDNKQSIKLETVQTIQYMTPTHKKKYMFLLNYQLMNHQLLIQIA